MRYLIIFVTSSIACFGAYFYLYESGDREIPVISPLKYPYKIKASSGGDLLNPEKDKTIYDNFAKNKPTDSKVQIAPSPEDPIALQTPETIPQGAEFDVFGTQETGASQEVKLLPAAQAKNKEIATSPKDEASIWDMDDRIDNHIDNGIDNGIDNRIDERENHNQGDKEATEEQTVEIITTQTKDLKVTNVKDSKIASLKTSKKQIGHFIHLGIFRSEQDAKKEWTIIKANNKKSLGALDCKIKHLKKNTGHYYELLVGPYKEFKDAKLTCRKITLGNQKCIVVKNNS